MAKHKEYWEKRFELLEDAQNRKAIEYFAELEKQYNKAALSVQDDINKWYARFAVNNEISLQEAKKMLNANELKEFKWNVMEYIEKGKTLNYSDAWAKQLENASARWHISRLDALKLQMQNHVEALYGNELDEVTALMTDIYTDGYYHTAYEIQKGFNIGYDLMKLDKNRIDKVLSKPWAVDGSNFSDRIWKHKNQLVSELHNNLTQAIIRGQDPSTVTKMISERFNVSKGRASALVMTESAFFSSASDRDCFKDLGVERYEILATLDHSTSDICRSLDGKVFPMSEYAVGVTAPPFHVRCRTTTVPFFDDEFELDTTRAARDEDGKTYQVPASMKYEDWKNSFVDGGSKKDLTPINDIDSADSESVLDSVQKMNDESASQEKAQKKEFVPAKDVTEVQDRIKLASGGAKVDFNNMDVRVANDYLQGIEEFYAEYPELKGYIDIIDTKRSHIGAAGQFEVTWNMDKATFRPKAEVHFANQSYDDYKANIIENIESGYKFAGSNGTTTAKHELTHALQSEMYYMEKGLYADGQFTEQNIFSFKESKYSFISDSNKIVNKAAKKVYGKEYNSDKIKFLGDYAKQDRDELVAQAISYEMSGNTHPFSAEVKRIFDEKYEKAFGVKPNSALENIGKSVTMKLQADINKMITPYEKKVLDAIPKKEGFFDFAAHGSATNIEYGSKDNVLTAREVARVIKHSESYHGEKVRLLSCSTGSVEDGFAQQLANALGVEVEAPSDVLIVSPNGSYKIGYDGSGEMKTFKPKGRK